MAQGISTALIRDLMDLTLKSYEQNKWVDAVTPLTEYYIFPNLARNFKRVQDGGTGPSWPVVVDTADAAGMDALYSTDTLQHVDLGIMASLDWRHFKSNYCVDRRQLKMNTGKAALMNTLEVKEWDARMSLVKTWESQGWGKPTDSTNTLDMMGMRYWLVRWPTGTVTPGFTGANPTGFSSGAAGINTDTYSLWKNYAGKFTEVTKGDLIRKLREAKHKTTFTDAVPRPGLVTGRDDHGVYAPYSVYELFVEAAEKQNGMLGNDVASKDGKVTFMGSKVNYVPALDSDTGIPVYCLNWSLIDFIFLAGCEFETTVQEHVAGSHNVSGTFYDQTGNLCFKSRRQHAVLSKLSETGTTT